MKISRLLRRPTWESREPSVRARAVSELADAELLAQLDQIARLDPAPEVRAAALRRVGDLALLADRMAHDGDADVRQLARQRLMALTCEANSTEAVQAALRVLRVLEDSAFDLDIARNAQSPTLRRLALTRIAKPGFLLDRCQNDPDAEIRLFLLDRVEGTSTLDRLAEATRKTDKTLSRMARERAQSLRVAAGEPEALRQRALALAEELDRLRRERPEDVHARASTLLDEWQGLRPRVDASLARRVDGYVETLRASLDYVRPTTEDAETMHAAAADTVSAEPPAEAVAVTPASPAPPDPDLERRTAERAAQREAERAARQAALDRAQAEHIALQAVLSELEHALSAKQLAPARAAHAQMLTLRQTQSEPMREQPLARLRRAEHELDELARWQHWSNNKVRARLCEALQAVIGSGLHPDAVALKVKQTQAQWQQLAQSEHAPHAPAAAETGLDRRFRGLCHRLLAPARPYFEKRGELRDQRKHEVDAVLARADDVLAQGQAPARIALRRQLVAWLQRLDDLDPRDRAPVGKRLREYLARCDQARAAEDEQTQQGKHKLIANLRRKLAQAELDDALELCSAAQAQWRTLPRAARATEQTLQAEFDALVQPWFDQARERSATQAAAASARESGLQSILSDLDALAGGDDEALKHAATQLTLLNTRWRELRHAEPASANAETTSAARADHRTGRPGERGRDEGRRPRAARAPDPLERRYDAAVERVQQALRARESRREREILRALGEAAQCCMTLEALAVAQHDADTWRARWQALGIPAAAQALHARFERALHARGDDEARAAATEQAAELVALAELLAGIDSPESARETRRALQVARLQARLSGAASADTSVELREVYQRWCATGPLQADSAPALAERMRRATRALFD